MKNIEAEIAVVYSRSRAKKIRHDLPELDEKCDHYYRPDASYRHEYSSDELTCFMCEKCEGILQVVKDEYLDKLYGMMDYGSLENRSTTFSNTVNENSLCNKILAL